MISSSIDFCVCKNKKLAKSLSPSCFLASAMAYNHSTVVIFLVTIKSATSRLLRRAFLRLFAVDYPLLTFVAADFLFLPASRRAAVEALVRGDPTRERSG